MAEPCELRMIKSCILKDVNEERLKLFIQENLMDGTRKYFEVISSESLEEWYAQLREEVLSMYIKVFL